MIHSHMKNNKTDFFLIIFHCFGPVEDYVRCLDDSKGLEDKLCRQSQHFDEGSRQIFPCHLTPVQIHEGIKAKKLFQGSFQASRENFLEGQVNVESFEKPVSNRSSLTASIFLRT